MTKKNMREDWSGFEPSDSEIKKAFDPNDYDTSEVRKLMKERACLELKAKHLQTRLQTTADAAEEEESQKSQNDEVTSLIALARAQKKSLEFLSGPTKRLEERCAAANNSINYLNHLLNRSASEDLSALDQRNYLSDRITSLKQEAHDYAVSLAFSASFLTFFTGGVAGCSAYIAFAPQLFTAHAVAFASLSQSISTMATVGALCLVLAVVLILYVRSELKKYRAVTAELKATKNLLKSISPAQSSVPSSSRLSPANQQPVDAAVAAPDESTPSQLKPGAN